MVSKVFWWLASTSLRMDGNMNKVLESKSLPAMFAKYRDKLEAEALEREQQEQDSRAIYTASRLRELRERERVQIDSIEERRREMVRVTS